MSYFNLSTITLLLPWLNFLPLLFTRFYPAVYLHSSHFKTTQCQLELVVGDNIGCDQGEGSNPSLLLLVKLIGLTPAKT